MFRLTPIGCCFLLASLTALAPAADAPSKVPSASPVEAQLLIVGGSEAGVAAAVQAARLGVADIVLVNDIDWLGGQFSAEGVGAVDEWTIYRGKRVNFPRSGLFLEVMQEIARHNQRTYGIPRPGHAVTASDTIEPAAAARLFEQLVAPYGPLGSKQLRIERGWIPERVAVEANRIAGVTFTAADGSPRRLTVRARLTIDASDWGDIVRLSGTDYLAGPDVRSAFGEPSAPEGPLGADRAEMNPITYCVVMREADGEALLPAPGDYDRRKYFGTSRETADDFARLEWPRGVWQGRVPAFLDSAYPEGIYSTRTTPYTQRRLVDRHHEGLPMGSETILFNWPVQDYPLYDFPAPVIEALESREPGSSTRNIAELDPALRAIVFADAKRHSLGMIRHLQELPGEIGAPFRRLRLVEDFGTDDRLPPKPYVREGLRLQALLMLREQDLRTPHDEPRWARVMPPDSLFGFQFNIDFHPTRRAFLGGDRNAPWGMIHTANRNWSTHTDRAMFSLRGLIPRTRDGLLGSSKNIGVTSIASAALRLHGQMMLCGQAAGTVAWIALRDQIEPRDVAGDPRRIRTLQRVLVQGVDDGPGVLLWPFHDLPPDDLAFVAANHLAVRGIFRPDADSVDFQPWREVTRSEVLDTLRRAARSVERIASPPDSGPLDEPGGIASWGWFHEQLRRHNLEASDGLTTQAGLKLTRSELVRHLWHAIERLPERFPDVSGYLAPGHDADGDGIPDLDDPLPFDRNNDNVPDLLDE